VTLEQYVEAWLPRMAATWRPATVDLVESNVRRHVLPFPGRRPLASIRRGDVEAWAGSLKLAPSTVATVGSTSARCSQPQSRTECPATPRRVLACRAWRIGERSRCREK
jgi:hypothetical protein